MQDTDQLIYKSWDNTLHDGYFTFIILQNNYKHCHINAIFCFMAPQPVNGTFNLFDRKYEQINNVVSTVLWLLFIVTIYFICVFINNSSINSYNYVIRKTYQFC